MAAFERMLVVFDAGVFEEGLSDGQGNPALRTSGFVVEYDGANIDDLLQDGLPFEGFGVTPPPSANPRGLWVWEGEVSIQTEDFIEWSKGKWRAPTIAEAFAFLEGRDVFDTHRRLPAAEGA